MLVKMTQRESRSMNCVRKPRRICWASSRILRPSLPFCASPRSPAVLPTSSPRCTFYDLIFSFWFCLFSQVSVSDFFLCFIVSVITERWWGCRLRKCWRWFPRSRRRLWEKFTRRRNTCPSICVPRRPGPFVEGSPNTRFRRLCFDRIF